MAVGDDTRRETITIPKAHIEAYNAEVIRLRLLGERTSRAELIRNAIAKDVRRIERARKSNE